MTIKVKRRIGIRFYERDAWMLDEIEDIAEKEFMNATAIIKQAIVGYILNYKMYGQSANSKRSGG